MAAVETGLRVYARVRPAAGGASPDGGAIDAKGCTVSIGGGPPAQFSDAVLGAGAGNDRVFAVAGARVVDSCLQGSFPKGGFGAVVAYGESGSGRTHTIVGTASDPGAAPRALRHLFANGATALQLQACQTPNDACQDLLGPGDAVKIGVDDRLGVTTELRAEECTSADAAEAVLARAVAARGQRAAHVGCAAEHCHFILLVGVHRRDGPSGRLALIDLAPSDRFSEAAFAATGGSPQNRRGASARQRTLAVLETCMGGVAQGQDHRTLPFRDTKLTRVLQHPLAYAGARQGEAAIVVCLRPDGARDRRARSVAFAARCRPDPTLSSMSELRDRVAHLEGDMDESDRRAADAEARVPAAQTAHSQLVAQCHQAEQELVRVAQSLEGDALALRKQSAAEHGRGERDRNESLRAAAIAARQELDTAKEVIGGTSGATDARIAAMAQQAETDMFEARRRADREVARAKEEADKLTFEAAARSRRAHALHAWQARVEAEIQALEQEEEALEGKYKVEVREGETSGSVYDQAKPLPNRTEGLSPEELRRKRGYFALVDEVDDLEEHVERQKAKVDALRKETGVDVDMDSEDASGSDVEAGPGVVREFTGQAEAENDVTPPPSDGTAPSDGSSNIPPSMPSTPPRSRPSTPSSAGGSPSSGGGAAAGGGAPRAQRRLRIQEPQEAPETEEEMMARLQREQAERERAAKEAKEVFEREKEQLDWSIQRQDKLDKLCESIMRYLEYGSVVTVVMPDGGAAEGCQWLQRCFMYHSREGSLLCVCHMKPDQEAPPAEARKAVKDVIELKHVRRIVLGQTSQAWQECKRKVRSTGDADPTHPMHPNCVGLAKNTSTASEVGKYYYRSITVEIESKKRQSFDFIAETNQDYEAWLICLHRLSRCDPTWGVPLNISHNKGYRELTELERRFCQTNHILPTNYVNAKKQVLGKNRIFVNLYDVRPMSALDLIHSQKLFNFFCTTGFIDTTTLWPIRYAEKMAEKEEGKEEEGGKEGEEKKEAE